jgi:hypothetical protein
VNHLRVLALNLAIIAAALIASAIAVLAVGMGQHP